MKAEVLRKVAASTVPTRQVLKEFGWLDEGSGYGFEIRGSGYSEI